jgi:hypothetical protein
VYSDTFGKWLAFSLLLHFIQHISAHLQILLHPYLQNNPKFWPFFKGVIGAIDGSHIALSCPATMRAACRNRKGYISQNCLFCCTFDMLFTYALTGWEGSISDAHLWEVAHRLQAQIPDGCFLLADAGFPHC